MGAPSGKTALVTGASRGIGRAIALRLAADGARVAVHYNSHADAAAGPLPTSGAWVDVHFRFAINVKATFFIIQRALPIMSDGGRIVNISSTAGRIAVSQQIAYAMTKATLQVMSRTLANEVGARRITVNSVAPGATDSNVNAALQPEDVRSGLAAATTLGRIGDAADIADVVAFLASDDARWITANHIDATAGLYLGPINQGEMT